MSEGIAHRGPSRRGALLWPALACFALVLATQLWRVGVPPMAGTEAFRAIPGHEMAESGDWRLPTIYGELYLRKPPGHPWLLAAAETIAGAANEWVWRSVSVLSSAALAGLLAVMAGRWFGLAAAWVAGMGYLTLIGLWAQSRAAEIDAALTFACVACALCFMEIGFGPRKRVWPWAAAAGFTLGATLLIKFHAGLVVVAGALLGAPLANGLWLAGGARSRLAKLWRYIASCPWRWLVRPMTLAAILGGVGLFVGWALVAWGAIRQMPDAPDLSGLREAGGNTLDLARLGRSLLVPLTLLAMALPPALALLLAPALCRRHGEEPSHRPILSRGLLGLVAVSFLVLIVNGVTNPRYGYITLPFWALLAGRAGELWWRGRLGEPARRLGRQIATGLVVGVPVGHIVVTAVAWPETRQPWALGVALALAVGVAAIGARWWIRQRLIAGGLAVVAAFALLSVPVGDIKEQARWSRSALQPGRAMGRIVRDNPIADKPAVTAFKMLRDKPELFWYARLPVNARYHQRHANQGLPPINQPGWYVLQHEEWRALQPTLDGATVETDLGPQGVLVRYSPDDADAAESSDRQHRPTQRPPRHAPRP